MNFDPTFDEMSFIAELESAQPKQLAQMLLNPTAREEKILRVYLGDARYRAMHAAALAQAQSRALRQPRGNVVVIHGIMGGELTAHAGSQSGGASTLAQQIWVKLARLISGQFGWLALNAAGDAELDRTHRIEATGILKSYYGELLLSLSRNWNVCAFWYDWRKSLDEAATLLHRKLIEWFESAPVHLVAHSMGGLVARTFINRYPDHWKKLWDDNNGRAGGRLVMLGTPNHGAFIIPQIFTGAESLLRKLAFVDLSHSLDDIVTVANTFIGAYQMLPSPFVPGGGAFKPLYQAPTYKGAKVSQTHLDTALRHHEILQETVDPARMIYVAGYDQPTYDGIKDWGAFVDRNAKKARKAYSVTLAGDGRVPHSLGLLPGVPTYFVDAEHGELSRDRAILAALDDLLVSGVTRGLQREVPVLRTGTAQDAARRMEECEEEDDKDEKILEAYVSVRQRRGPGNGVQTPNPSITAEERMAEERITRRFLSARGVPSRRVLPTVEVPFGPPELKIRLICDDIGSEGFLGKSKDVPAVDAISVGHYRAVRPINAELALDRVISAPLGPVNGEGKALLITDLSERGTITGELGQPFLIPDFRDAQSIASGRLVAVAGMGDTGCFGEPELTVLVRELVWSLSRLGKRHLASVLIGSGAGNLEVPEAVSAWVRGFKHALTGVSDTKCLNTITFVEYDPERVRQIDIVLRDIKGRLDQERMKINYEGFSQEELRKVIKKREEERIRNLSNRKKGEEREEKLAIAPTRLTVSLDGDTYRYGALTEDASVPERDVDLDPRLVTEANDQIAAEYDLCRQQDRAIVLGQLLLPQELRPHLSTRAPLVLLLDRKTAGIHWEMVSLPGTNLSAPGTGGERQPDEMECFGTTRGVTRQLRTGFSPPPEPPPPPQRVLRVLVVANPAVDAPLKGAEEEGSEVAAIFESYNTLLKSGPNSKNRVQVMQLLGPLEATRLAVLSELTLRSYDVLHFAGHCFYNRQNPSASGWIFSNGEVLSAKELRRIDRVPRFVFSNACESGLAPDEQRTADLAPSFAEAFFLKGVTNFVCTAWPIDDIAASTFARVLYLRLLGLRKDMAEAGDGDLSLAPEGPEAMYDAMRHARLAVMKTSTGFRTWGAYQHYGNPYFRFFAPARSSKAAQKESERSETSEVPDVTVGA